MDWGYHDVRDFNVSDLLPASDYFTKRVITLLEQEIIQTKKY